MKEKLQRTIPVVLGVVCCGLLVFFLWWHGKFALTRYFDVDEFAHLHWTSHMLMGNRPYVDFLTFFPPGFLWFLSPMFAIGWGTVTPIVAARVAMFTVFVGIVIVTALLFWEMRGNGGDRRRAWLALVPAVLLAFLPLPFDKFVEIRPDNPATLLLLFGMYFQVRSLRRKGETFSGWASGFCYGASVVVLTKMIPVVLPGIALAVWELWKEKKTTFAFFIGLGVPLLVTGLWLLTLGDFGTVWYSLVQLPLEANRISRIFFMAPDLFFYPNGYYYGTNGWSRELLTNHILWIAGLLVGTYRLLTPFLMKRAKMELLVSGTFFLQVMLYVQFIPLKHAQYLIPIAPFVAWYVADGILIFWVRMRRSLAGLFAFGIAFLAVALYLVPVFLAGNGPKLVPSNAASLEALQTIYQTIPTSQFILDLDGRTLYYPDPYYVCCLPFGQFAPFLTRKLPSLANTLEETNTKYIYQGQLERVGTLLPQDQEYIGNHFQPLSDTNRELLVRNN